MRGFRGGGEGEEGGEGEVVERLRREGGRGEGDFFPSMVVFFVCFGKQNKRKKEKKKNKNQQKKKKNTKTQKRQVVVF